MQRFSALRPGPGTHRAPREHVDQVEAGRVVGVQRKRRLLRELVTRLRVRHAVLLAQALAFGIVALEGQEHKAAQREARRRGRCTRGTLHQGAAELFCVLRDSLLNWGLTPLRCKAGTRSNAIASPTTWTLLHGAYSVTALMALGQPLHAQAQSYFSHKEGWNTEHPRASPVATQDALQSAYSRLEGAGPAKKRAELRVQRGTGEGYATCVMLSCQAMSLCATDMAAESKAAKRDQGKQNKQKKLCQNWCLQWYMVGEKARPRLIQPHSAGNRA